MARGTGVCTYSRVLAEALTMAGHQVDMPSRLNIDPAQAGHGARLVRAAGVAGTEQATRFGMLPPYQARLQALY